MFGILCLAYAKCTPAPSPQLLLILLQTAPQAVQGPPSKQSSVLAQLLRSKVLVESGVQDGAPYEIAAAVTTLLTVLRTLIEWPPFEAWVSAGQGQGWDAKPLSSPLPGSCPEHAVAVLAAQLPTRSSSCSLFSMQGAAAFPGEEADAGMWLSVAQRLLHTWGVMQEHGGTCGHVRSAASVPLATWKRVSLRPSRWWQC